MTDNLSTCSNMQGSFNTLSTSACTMSSSKLTYLDSKLTLQADAALSKIKHQSLHYKSKQNFKPDQINKPKPRKEEEQKALAAKTKKSKVAKSKSKTSTRYYSPTPNPVASRSKKTNKTSTSKFPEIEPATKDIKQDPKDYKIANALKLAMEEDADTEDEYNHAVDDFLFNEVMDSLDLSAEIFSSQADSESDDDSDEDEDLFNGIMDGLEDEHSVFVSYDRNFDEYEMELIDAITAGLEKSQPEELRMLQAGMLPRA